MTYVAMMTYGDVSKSLKQVEHHLFPALSHDALRKLAPTIHRVCREHGVHFK
jgi:hypothetical protein